MLRLGVGLGLPQKLVQLPADLGEISFISLPAQHIFVDGDLGADFMVVVGGSP